MASDPEENASDSVPPPATSDYDRKIASAAVPVSADDAAYQLGFSVTCLSVMQRQAWVENDEQSDRNVHVALDSIENCIDVLERRLGTSDRTTRIIDLVAQARESYDEQMDSPEHFETSNSFI